MKILFASSECTPFAKAGGLGDVIGALPKEISKYCTVATVIPRYKCTLAFPTQKIAEKEIVLGWRKYVTVLSETEFNGVKTYFIENSHYFGGENIYGYNDGEKFAFFSKAVVEFLPNMGILPDILHCNDWQTGLIPLFIKNSHYKIKTVFTVHNLCYKGLCDFNMLKELFAFPVTLYTPETLEFYGNCSFLKAGLLYGNRLTCVSPSYRNETLLPENGEGLEGVLQMRANDYIGILNGLGEEFDPEKDVFIKKNYSSKKFSGKAVCKKALQNNCGFSADSSVPVFAFIARFCHQKGIELIEKSIGEILSFTASQFVFLGTGDKYYEDFLMSLSRDFPDRIKTHIGFDVDLAQRIYSGSDFFLMPSRFEPCGLSQLIAMKYASLPVVHSCGGLKDTVQDTSIGGNGFTFEDFSEESFKNAVFRACNVFKDNALFKKLQKNAMQEDFSWQKSGKLYYDIYKDLTGGKK